MRNFAAMTVTAVLLVSVGVMAGPAGAASSAKCSSEAAAVAAAKAQWSSDSAKVGPARKVWFTDRATVKVDVKKLHDDVKAKNKSAIGPDKTQLTMDRTQENADRKTMTQASQQVTLDRAQWKTARGALHACLRS